MATKLKVNKLVTISNEFDQFGDIQFVSTSRELIDTGGNVISEVLESYLVPEEVMLILNCS